MNCRAADTDMRSPLVTSPDSSSAPSPVHYTVDTAIASAHVESELNCTRPQLRGVPTLQAY